MRTAILPSITGENDTYQCYTWKEFPYWSLSKRARKCTKRSMKWKSYLENICTFDIETTTVPADEPYAFMYHWQVCIDGKVAYGRTWAEWESFFRKLSDRLELSEDRILAIYVHNLGFEYQHMKDFLRRMAGDLNVFATQPRKPLRISTETGLEFRCSWKLSNMGLEKFTQNEFGVLHRKLAGDLDYRIMRTPDTALSDKEFGYCIADVVGLYEAIKSKLANHGDSIESIPMTSTGYVRRDCRRSTRKDPHYRELFNRCRMDRDTYRLLREAARGGDTHASRRRSGRMQHDVDSYDVQSSYPAMMMLKKFPMTKFVPYGQIESLSEFRKILNENACLFVLTLIGLRPKSYHMSPYIPDAKCHKISGAILDNGRILEAKGLSITVTDIDFELIERQYEWDEMYVDDMHIADYGYLPDSLLSVVMDYFKKKTELKARRERCTDPTEKANLQYLYDRSKNSLNGIFGMLFTDPVHDILTEMEDGTWKKERPDIDAALEKYNKSRNSFLIYAWGVWVTCNARRHLADLVEAGGQEAAIYCDTDSDKGTGMDHQAIEELNARIRRECEERGAYADAEGVRYYLGIYERETEEPYQTFITLGAKKYAYEDGEGLHLTISGVDKEEGAKELGRIENFKAGFIFKDAGGLEMTYRESPIKEIEVDGCRIETASHIAVRDSTYTIGITREYADLIGYDLLID